MRAANTNLCKLLQVLKRYFPGQDNPSGGVAGQREGLAHHGGAGYAGGAVLEGKRVI